MENQSFIRFHHGVSKRICRALWSCLIIFVALSPVLAQQLIGTYHSSVPEAALFSLDPRYLNPAVGRGVMGLDNNPATLGMVKGRELIFAIGLPQSSDGEFEVQATDSSDVYSPIYLDTRVRLKESFGLGAIGYAQQMGRWRWGVALLQARKAGISLEARGHVDMDTHFEVDQPLTREIVPELPVEEIPVTWDVNSTVRLNLSSDPAKLYISVLPITSGLCYRLGPWSVGAGLTYYHISSSDETATLTALVEGTASGIGVPSGTDPATNQPWQGTVSADVVIQDQPLIARYTFDVSGHRWATSMGTTLNFGFFSIGGSYTHGFRGKVKGRYDLNTIHTIGLPDDNYFSNVALDWSTRPQLKGHSTIEFTNFVKDTLSHKDSGTITMQGFHGFSFGLHFLVFGAFAGGKIPQETPDFASLYFGGYLEFPIPKTPVRFNAGLIYCTDGIQGDDDHIAPYRITTHISSGIAMKLPLNKWIHIGNQASWLRLGLRSSLISMALDMTEDDTGETREENLPSVAETLGASIGMEIPF